MKTDILNSTAVEQPGAGAEEKNSALAPGDGEHNSERNMWLDTMADYEVKTDRRLNHVVRRIERLESRARIIATSEEMKTFLVMTAISIACAVLVPLMQGAIEKWRRSS